jgi:hypothetical protein
MSMNLTTNWGAEYLIQAQNSHKGSRPGSTLKVRAEPLPKVNYFRAIQEKNSSLYLIWDKVTPPKEMANETFLYRISVSESQDMRTAINITTNLTEYTYTGAVDGKVYHVAVSVEVNGYCGPSSEPQVLGSMKDAASITLSRSNAVGILIPITILIVVILSALAVFVFRHRRLQRSFLSFANSHYDTRSGSASFSAHESLEEEDGPVIRGFSDDEPLVLA